MVFVTLTLLQVAVEEKECPVSRYLPLCIYSEAVTYLKEVIEELSNKIEQSSDSKGYTRILDSINLQEEEKWAPESDSDPTTILVKYNGVNRNPYVKWSTFSKPIQSKPTSCVLRNSCLHFMAAFHSSQTCSKAQKEVGVYLYRGAGEIL